MSSVDMGKTGDLTGSAPKMALTVTLYELICKILCHHGMSWPFSWGSCICFDRFEILPEAIVRGSSSSRRCSSRRNATGGQCDVQSFGVRAFTTNLSVSLPLIAIHLESLMQNHH